MEPWDQFKQMFYFMSDKFDMRNILSLKLWLLCMKISLEKKLIAFFLNFDIR